MAQKIIYNCF